jgi:hypothetical protein
MYYLFVGVEGCWLKGEDRKVGFGFGWMVWLAVWLVVREERRGCIEVRRANRDNLRVVDHSGLWQLGLEESCSGRGARGC